MVSVRLDELKLIWNWLVLNRMTPEIVTRLQDPANCHRHPWLNFVLNRDGLLRVGLSTEWQRHEIGSAVELSFKIQMVLATLENKQLEDFKYAHGLPENSVWALARTVAPGLIGSEGTPSMIGHVLEKLREETK